MTSAEVEPIKTVYANAQKHVTLLYEQCGTTKVMQVADGLPKRHRLRTCPLQSTLVENQSDRETSWDCFGQDALHIT